MNVPISGPIENQAKELALKMGLMERFKQLFVNIIVNLFFIL